MNDRSPCRSMRAAWPFLFARGILVCLAVLCTACVTMQQTRSRYVSSHPDLTPEQKQAVLNGQILAGFAQDMVLATWGQPVDRVQEVINGQNTTSWIYQETGYDYLKTYRVRFSDGLVTDVRLINMRQKVYSPYNRRYYWRHYPEYPDNYYRRYP